MDRQQILQILSKEFADEFNLLSTLSESDRMDAHLDSMDFIELIVTMEDIFAIRISDDEVVELGDWRAITFGQMVDLAYKKVQAK